MLFGLVLIAGIARAQHPIASGEYRSIDGSISLLVARPSGKNWTVRGTLYPSGGSSISVSGTLYDATGKVSLKGLGLEEITGSYSVKSGTIKLSYTVRDREQESRECFNSKNLETVWVLEPGYPKTPAKPDENIHLVTVDGFSGTLTWKNFAKKDGNFIDQTFKFYVPKSVYRPGEIFEWFADGTTTDHAAIPVAMIILRSHYLNRPAQSPYYGVVGMDTSTSGFNESVGWRSTQKIKVVEPNGMNDRLRFVVGIVGDVLEWLYRPELRPKGAKDAGLPAKPAEDTNSTTKPPKDVDDSGIGRSTTISSPPASVTASQVTGDVSFRTIGGGSDYRPLTTGTVLTSKMEIDVDPEGSATLRLPNGGIITIKGGTRLRLEELTSSGGQARVVVRMMMGEVLYRHAANAAANTVRGDFVIRMNESVTSSLGTEFSAKFDAKTFMVTIDLREGKLEFNPGMKLDPIILEAPQVFTIIAPPPTRPTP